MQEAEFQSKLLRALRSHAALRDAVIWKLNDRTTRGIPDVLVFVKGIVTFFELKRFPNNVTKIQAYWLKKLHPRAFLVTLLRNGEIFFSPDTVGLLYTFDAAVEWIVRRCIS